MGDEGGLGWILSGLIASGGVGPLRIPSCPPAQDAHKNKTQIVVKIRIAFFLIQILPYDFIIDHLDLGSRA
jgi:hypothetical protein